ncbi:hypothetical protein C8Q79DRAFT_652149 [Trametes meyenii]|nr:hypothetical protein C8Q79DRAFT_652149 [Trametes meyenii]
MRWAVVRIWAALAFFVEDPQGASFFWGISTARMSPDERLQGSHGSHVACQQAPLSSRRLRSRATMYCVPSAPGLKLDSGPFLVCKCSFGRTRFWTNSALSGILPYCTLTRMVTIETMV